MLKELGTIIPKWNKKIWGTNGQSSDVIIVFCLTAKGIGVKESLHLLLKKESKGLSIGKKEDKLGIRGSDTCEIYLKDCQNPITNLIAEEGQGGLK
ncbi:MAG: hypothetical protein Ct9H300mP2_4510 [Candidatus Neomarinimicrobiota bacterium]|nr:MAG: hypothetical protein Ct9H300mP2_4510 [Candidatus Neomarinimicrobiota bacterium]